MPAAWTESVAGHKERQAQRITNAAIELVFERGVSALSMAAIARAAGISRQTLYKYFPDVSAILRAAVQSTGGHDLAAVEAAGSPSDQLGAFVQYALSAAAAGHPTPSVLEPVLAPDVRKELKTHAAQVRGLLAVILQRGMDEGEFRADLDPDLDAEIVYRTVMGAYELVTGASDSSLAADHVERAVLAMVGNA